MLRIFRKRKKPSARDYYLSKPSAELIRPSMERIWIGHAQKTGQPIYLPDRSRSMHVQIVGSTGAGKTESVILPWAIQDMFRGRGVIIIDGKSDAQFLTQIGAYAFEMGLAHKLKIFSLSHPSQSRCFNPLSIGSEQEVADRLFSSMEFGDPFYKEVQKECLQNLVSLAFALNSVTLRTLHRLLEDSEHLASTLEQVNSSGQASDAVLYFKNFLAAKEEDRVRRTLGLKTQLASVVGGEMGPLLSPGIQSIDLMESMNRGEVLYFQLPTLKYRVAAPMAGKLILQAIQGVAARRHSGADQGPMVSVFLDEFASFVYEGFVELLNKARSANIAIHLAHQSIGDLRRVSEAFELGVLSNTNLKVIMRTLDPESAEFLASGFGTRASEARTEQVQAGTFKDSFTGMSSLRQVREYGFHPDLFKSLPAGQAVISVPVAQGVYSDLLSLRRLSSLPEPMAVRTWS